MNGQGSVKRERDSSDLVRVEVKRARGEDHFSPLPPEVITYIFHLLNQGSREGFYESSLLSRRFNAIWRAQPFWRQVLEENRIASPENDLSKVEGFLGYSIPDFLYFDLKGVKTIEKELAARLEDRGKETKILEVSASTELASRLKYFPNLERLVIDFEETEFSYVNVPLHELLEQARGLKVLHFRNTAFSFTSNFALFLKNAPKLQKVLYENCRSDYCELLYNPKIEYKIYPDYSRRFRIWLPVGWHFSNFESYIYEIKRANYPHDITTRGDKVGKLVRSDKLGFKTDYQIEELDFTSLKQRSYSLDSHKMYSPVFQYKFGFPPVKVSRPALVRVRMTLEQLQRPKMTFENFKDELEKLLKAAPNLETFLIETGDATLEWKLDLSTLENDFLRYRNWKR